jgi:hypothetical protein
MLHSHARKLILLLALAVLYAGPVVACACADQDVSGMPCCPDQHGGSTHVDHLLPHAGGTPCSAVSADFLGTDVVAFDVSAPAAMANPLEQPGWARGPPPPIISVPALPPNKLPLYLTTLRLRN